MLSSPIGLGQHAAARFVNVMVSVSIVAPACGLTTVLKLPNVFPSVSAMVNTVAAFRLPVSVNGIFVVLE